MLFSVFVVQVLLLHWRLYKQCWPLACIQSSIFDHSDWVLFCCIVCMFCLFIRYVIFCMAFALSFVAIGWNVDVWQASIWIARLCHEAHHLCPPLHYSGTAPSRRPGCRCLWKVHGQYMDVKSTCVHVQVHGKYMVGTTYIMWKNFTTDNSNMHKSKKL